MRLINLAFGQVFELEQQKTKFYTHPLYSYQGQNSADAAMMHRVMACHFSW